MTALGTAPVGLDKTTAGASEVAVPDVAANRTITSLDLFAGAGGLTAGLAQGGDFHAVQAVEWDVAAAATFSANHPGTEVHAGAIQDWLAEGAVPEVDVIVGGPPCQGFSTLGKQDVEDERNDLWHEYARTIVRARPKYFVVENVAAFMKSPQYALFRDETVAGGRLADYAFRADVLNAADYGAPQLRKRAVLIGHHRDLPFPGWPEKNQGDPLTVDETFTQVGDEPSENDLPDRWVTFRGKNLPGVFLTGELHLGRDYTQLSKDRFAAIPAGGNRFDLPEHLLAPCWVKHKSGSGDVMGRLHRDRPAVTIRTEFFKPEKGRYLHPEANRAITHLEAALLQGFPLNYKWVGSKTAIARQIGNAVPLHLGKAIGEVLARAPR